MWALSTLAGCICGRLAVYITLAINKQLSGEFVIDPKTMPFLPVENGNHLVQTGSRRDQRNGMDNDDDFYDEVKPNGEVVARYRVWHHMNIYPPQNVYEGWEKKDLAGNVVANGSKGS
jgi:hypothetical protein